MTERVPRPYLRRPLDVRLFKRVNKVADGCWLWTGQDNGAGYGMIRHCGQCERRLMVHRVAYELLVGPIPDGLFLDHLCRTPRCVRPDHLEPVTNAQNLLRGNGFGAVNARKTECLRGHPLSGDNLLVSCGMRVCRTCKRARQRACRARVGAA